MLASVAIVLLGAGCVKSQPIPESNPTVEKTVAPHEVVIGHFVFEPPTITVKAGEAVAWLHNDNVAHTVVVNGLFQSQTLSRGQKADYTFLQPGEYEYYCGIHPSMKGKVIVK